MDLNKLYSIDLSKHIAVVNESVKKRSVQRGVFRNMKIWQIS